MKDDRLYLIHIQECLARIEEYTVGGRKEFLASTLIQDAVLRKLHTLTESSQRVSAAVKAKHTDIDWKGMANFRNVLVHDYLGVDLQRVWEVLQRDLPDLKPPLLALLEGLGKPATPMTSKKPTIASKPRGKARAKAPSQRAKKRKK